MADGLTIQANAKTEKPVALANRELARSFSAQIGERQRFAFARTFTEAVVRSCWNSRGIRGHCPPAPAIQRIPLTPEASEIATAVGVLAAEAEPQQAGYIIGDIYTALLPDIHRSRYGVFYTPPAIVEHLLQMVEAAGADWRTCRVLDPACGGGAFLVAVALRIATRLKGAEPAFIFQQLRHRLKGFDIDPFGCWLAQITVVLALHRLAVRIERPAPSFVETRDSLKLQDQDFGSYDLVIGNPPYGRISLSSQERIRFKRSVYGHANLFGLFTDAALRWVKEGGIVGFVTPTSMLSGLYYKSLRELLAKEAPPLAVNFVVEREGVFADVLQETMLATYRKGGLPLNGPVGFITADRKEASRVQRAGSLSLPATATAPWLLPRLPEQSQLVRRLRAMPYRLADYGYSVSTGPLVWNRHKPQLRTIACPGAFPVVWAESVTNDGRFVRRSEKRNHAPWFATEGPKDDWLLVRQPCVLVQRTTAKEQARRLIAAEMPEEFFDRHAAAVVENHLNMVRAKAQKPTLLVGAIAALLNSRAADAAFRCINGSVAVSAFELEQLPVPPPLVMARVARLVARHASPGRIEAVIAAAYGLGNAAAAA